MWQCQTFRITNRSSHYPSLLLQSRLSMAAMSDSPALMALTDTHKAKMQLCNQSASSSLTTWVQEESSVQFEEFAVLSVPCLSTSINFWANPSILNRFIAPTFRLGFQHIHGRCDLSDVWFSVFWLPGNVDVIKPSKPWQGTVVVTNPAIKLAAMCRAPPAFQEIMKESWKNLFKSL